MKEKFFFSFFINIISYSFFIGTGYLLALTLEVEIIGLWTLLNSIINLGFLFIDVGFDSIHYQFSGKEDFEKYFGSFLFLKLLLIILNIICTLVLLFLLNFWLTKFFYSIIFLLFSKIFFCIGNIFLVNLRAHLKVFKAEFISFLTITGKSIFYLFLIFNKEIVKNPISYLISVNLFFNFINFILSISLSGSKLNKPHKNLIIFYLNNTKSLIIFSIFSVISTNLGNLLLSFFYGYKMLGYFSIINNYVIPLLLFISGCLIPLYLPLFSQYFEKNKIEDIEKITHIIEKYLSIIFLIIIIVIYLNSELIFQLFIPKYLKSIQILLIMIFIPYLIGITRPYGYHLIAGKKQSIIAYFNMVISISIIILMILFIPKKLFYFPMFGLGNIGYALAQTIPWILWAIGNRYLSYKYFKIKSQKKIILHIPLAFISFYISYFFKNNFLILIFQDKITILFISSFFSAIIFIFFMFLIKQLKYNDFKFFKDLIKIKIYIKKKKKEFSFN